MDDLRIYTSLTHLISLKKYAVNIPLSAAYRPAGMLSGQHASRLRGSGLNFEELRQYQDGDNVRQLDSRASARLGKPYIRVYSEETDRPVHVVVDQRNQLFFGSVNKTKSVVAAELASLVAWMANATGDRVGGIVVSDQVKQVPTTRSKQGILQLLALINEANQSLSINTDNDATEQSKSLFSHLKPWLSTLNSQSVVILITDIDGLLESDINELEMIHHKANVLLFIIQDPLESDISGAHGLSVSQGIKQINIKANQENQDKFTALYQAKLKRLKETIVNSPMPIGIVDTVKPVDQQLAELLLGHL